MRVRDRIFTARDRLRRHEPAVDVALALTIFVLNTVQLLPDEPDCDFCVVTPWAYVAAAMQSLPLVLRRRHPFAVNLAMAPFGIWSAFESLPTTPIPLGIAVGMYSLAAYGKRWQAFVGLGLVSAVTPVILTTRPDSEGLLEIVNTVGAVAGAWLLGESSRVRRQRDAANERLRSADAARVVAQERARIAREMHDLLTHSVSVMVVMAEGGAAAVERRPAEAVKAFDTISGTGRRTLDELRHLLGVLRAEADRRPLPGVADLPALVETMRSAGMDLTWREEPHAAIPATSALAAYRIAQEALTNALRHVPGMPVEVVVAGGDRTFTLEVSNALPGGGAGNGGSGRTGEGGQGLSNMRERAASIGGRLEAGPVGGRWRVLLTVTPSQRGTP